MLATNRKLIFSATDLSNFLACPHLSRLDLAVAFGAPKPPVYDDPALEALRERGLLHEGEYRRALEAEGRKIVEITAPEWEPGDERYQRHAADTVQEMERGADVIYQGALFDGLWFGKPDFLLRVERPSRFGGWSYEVVDAKLAREAKGGALLQVLLYSDLLEQAQGIATDRVHLALGGPEKDVESFRVADYAAYFRLLKERFLTQLRSTPGEIPIAPDPVAHCDLCAWRGRCEEERRRVDHLSLVAGITRRQREELTGRGIATLEALAALDLPHDPRRSGVAPASLERVRDQARIQLAGRVAAEPRYELILPIVEEQGLTALPEPSPGDLFLDLEGNPYALEYGLEYLFGFVDRDGEYTGWWALDRESEKAAFECFVDLVIARLERCPDLHVYHFAPYEPSALKRLMGFHATREEEVDRLLRGRVFVDLYRVVRQGVRASVESYSIKKLEPFYGYEREVDLREASLALSRFGALLEVGLYEEERDALLTQVEGYNRDDCVSTLGLRDWLEARRVELERATGTAIPRPQLPDGSGSEEHEKRRAEVAARMDALMEGVPADPLERTPEHQARWLLAQLLEFHRREKKAVWWEYFRCLELSLEEWEDDRSVLGGLEYVGVIETIKKSHVHRYRFPQQDHASRAGRRVVDPETKASPGTIVALDDISGTIDLKRGIVSDVPHPRALVVNDSVGDEELQQSLLRFADEVVGRGFSEDSSFRAAADLLLRRAPRAGQAAGDPLIRDGDDPVSIGREIVGRLDRTVLPIQGPPGTGKTHTGARMIVRALEDGKRVGVTGPSHKVISHLLDEVCRAAREAGVSVRGIQKAKEEEGCTSGEIQVSGDNQELRTELAGGNVNLAAGTAWLWSREEMIGSVDLLFVDEAGQFSLANALAVSAAAGSLVLLGDPQQLDQPLQGVHPPGAEASALEHLLAGAATVPPDRGLFLETTWRLNPAICGFTSELYYEGRLHSRPGLEKQVVRTAGPLEESGLRLVEVPHSGNTSDSPEEVEAIVKLVGELLAGASWVDENGIERPLTLRDILVVAPYNAQVAALANHLPEGARVGTVDKFQGQQAAISIYSVTTSSAADAPRGMDFLYSPNRLNVATSRAKCLAILVASPNVFAPESRTPKQMRLANGFCRFRELSDGVNPRTVSPR